jgi:hypothetical protein
MIDGSLVAINAFHNSGDTFWSRTGHSARIDILRIVSLLSKIEQCFVDLEVGDKSSSKPAHPSAWITARSASREISGSRIRRRLRISVGTLTS